MKSTYLLFVISIFIFSCSFDDTEVQEENFYALTVGNSWVYKYYTKDQTGNFSVFAHKTDSVKIVGTKVFNNNTYYEFYQKSVQTEYNSIPGCEIGEYESTFYQRDSLGYLVYNDGNISYWNNDYEERFVHSGGPSSTINVYSKLNELLTDITTEAGAFECFNLEFYAKDTLTNEQFPTASHFYYSDGIGNVCEKIGFLLGHSHFERRLDSFNVE